MKKLIKKKWKKFFYIITILFLCTILTSSYSVFSKKLILTKPRFSFYKTKKKNSNKYRYLFKNKCKYKIGNNLIVIIKDQLFNKNNNINGNFTKKNKNLTLFSIFLNTFIKLFNILHINNIYHPLKINNIEKKKMYLKKNIFINKNNLFNIVTVNIDSIFPNGLLKISGKKKILTNEILYYFYIYGIINPKFIKKKSIVYSNYLYNLKIKIYCIKINHKKKIV